MTDDRYYSEREIGELTRDLPVVGEPFWGGFVALYRRLNSRGYFAESFPAYCNDGPYLLESADAEALRLTFNAEIPRIEWPPDPSVVPETLDVLDAVEFLSRHVSRPTRSTFHSFFEHNHVHGFDREAGLEEYGASVNRLFRRCQHPYELRGQGRVERIGSPVLQEVLTTAAFKTGDDELDRLLGVAREKFLDPDPEMRAEAVEKLWDGWERLKTLVLPDDKKVSVKQLLDQVAPEPSFRAVIEAEAGMLTSIGNDFMIRHSEVAKPKIQRLEHLDYLFHRLFALIFMILKIRGGVA
jgi:hypothetical protein